MRILKDYTISDMHNFERKYPQRHKILFDFISECSTTSIFDKTRKRSSYTLSITLPYKGDFGCAIFSLVCNNSVMIIDTIIL